MYLEYSRVVDSSAGGPQVDIHVLRVGSACVRGRCIARKHWKLWKFHGKSNTHIRNFSGSHIFKLERTKAFQYMVTRDDMLFVHFEAFPRVAMYIFQASVHESQKRSVKALTKSIVNLESCTLIIHLVTAGGSENSRHLVILCQNPPSTGRIPYILEVFGSLTSQRAWSILESEVRDMYLEASGTLWRNLCTREREKWGVWVQYSKAHSRTFLKFKKPHAMC